MIKLPFLVAALLILCSACAPKVPDPKNLAEAGIRAVNLFLYYQDLDRAERFYTQTLGMEKVADYGMAKIVRVSADAYIILVDAEKGMHTVDEPKTVAVALLTEQVEAWYEYIKKQGIEIRYTLKTDLSKPHDGFVAVDPEGYLLEFERFNPHDENTVLIPLLTDLETLYPAEKSGSTVPDGLGFHSMVSWLYYKDLTAMQSFYENTLGLDMIVDQGWAKIYRASQTGFVGLVDQSRGMHSWTEKKAVNVGFIVDNLEGWYNTVKNSALFELRTQKLEKEPQGRYKAFVGYDPEGYYLEFDKFYPHEMNDIFLDRLK